VRPHETAIVLSVLRGTSLRPVRGGTVLEKEVSGRKDPIKGTGPWTKTCQSPQAGGRFKKRVPLGGQRFTVAMICRATSQKEGKIGFTGKKEGQTSKDRIESSEK